MADSTGVVGTPVTPAPFGQAADFTSPSGNGHSEVVANSGSVTMTFVDPTAVVRFAGTGTNGLTTGYIQSDTAGRGVIRITTNQGFTYTGTGSTLVAMAGATDASTLHIIARSVTMTTGTLTALGNGSDALDLIANGGSGSGGFDVTVDGDIFSAGGAAIVADQTNAAATGDILLTSMAGNTITSGDGEAIFIGSAGSGSITVNLADAVSATGGDGILIRGTATGNDISVTAAAVSALSMGDDAIDVQSSSTSADITIVANGAVSAGDDGVVAILLDPTATGNISVTTNGSVNAGSVGIYAVNAGTGTVTVNASGGITTTDDGIFASSAGGAITIAAGSPNANIGQGIDAQQLNATGNGAISITANGDVYGATGIRAVNHGTGAVTIAANGSVAASIARDAILVLATNAAAGAVDVTTSAGEVVSASHDDGIDIETAGTGNVAVQSAAAIVSGVAGVNTLIDGLEVIATGTGNIAVHNSGAIGTAGDRAQGNGMELGITNAASAGTIMVTGSGAILSVHTGIDVFTFGTGGISVDYSGAIDATGGHGFQVDTTSGAIWVTNGGSIHAPAGHGMKLESSTGNQTVDVGADIHGGAFDGVHAISNSGSITVNVNGGNITGAGDAVQLSSDGAKVVNVAAGRTLSGEFGLSSTGIGATTINNSGTITSTRSISSTTSATTINNFAGATINGAINLSGLNDAVVNSGTISGRLNLGAGSDLYDGRNGSVSASVDGGAGNDTLLGGAGAETMVGGLGDDLLEGNGGADNLTGGAGSDIFRGTATGFDGDTIADFTTGDRIVISDANVATFSFALNGNTLTFAGGSLTLGSVPTGRIVASAAAGGGVQLTIADAANDFNGDGRSDLAWLHTTAMFTTWLAQPNGSFANHPQSGANPLDASWRIVGTGDFNGDGRDDILWRHSSGDIGEWLGQSNGVFANNGGAAANAVDNSWNVVGVADYNGDGRDDILWRHSSGEVGQWVGLPNGGFANNGGAAANAVDPSWAVVANADFNGDGRADVLWRHQSGVYAQWQGSASGALVNAGAVLAGAGGSVVGSGDFNGDGRDDILMRAADGSIAAWLGQSNGDFASFIPTRQLLDANWRIVAIGDYNGDGSDDLLWRHSSGAAGEWLATGTGDFAYNGALETLDPSWQIQSPDIFLV